VIDWYLHMATNGNAIKAISQRWVSPPIGRYLDGEEETEGTYR